jgi:hypothetical protein
MATYNLGYTNYKPQILEAYRLVPPYIRKITQIVHLEIVYEFVPNLFRILHKLYEFLLFFINDFYCLVDVFS